MTKPRQCHGCKRMLGPNDNSTSISAQGRNVELCDSCWEKGMANVGLPQKLMSDVLGPVVRRGMGLVPDNVQDEPSNSAHIGERKMSDMEHLICTRGTADNSLWIGKGGGAVSLTPMGFRDDAAEKRAVQTPQKELPGTEPPPPPEPEHPSYSMILEAKPVRGYVGYEALMELGAFLVRSFPEMMARVIVHEPNRMAKWGVTVSPPAIQAGETAPIPADGNRG